MAADQLAASTEPSPPETGINRRDQKAVADALSQILADTYTLLAKTHGFHWNVTGPQFPALHEMFETQYRDLTEAVDEIAERIRALGVFAPGSLSQFKAMTRIEDEDQVPNARGMLGQLAHDHDLMARHCREVAEVSNEASDTATEDLMNGRMAFHEKSSWMLRATLAD